LKKNNSYKNEELYFIFFLFFFGVILYFWELQLDSEYKKEWQVSTTLFFLLIKYIVGRHNLETYNLQRSGDEESSSIGSNYKKDDDDAVKATTNKKFNIWFVILYLLISIFGIFGHNSQDKNPILAWVLFSAYLVLLYTLQEHVLF
jgi:hypothetical protein